MQRSIYKRTCMHAHANMHVLYTEYKCRGYIDLKTFTGFTDILSTVGNLNSTEMDHCILIASWTAPDTLQGVPINYTINITRHSDGAVLRSDTTNTTEYLYSVSSLGETLEVQ